MFRTQPVRFGAVSAVAVLAVGGSVAGGLQNRVAAATPGGGRAANGYAKPILLPQSSGLGEPSLWIDAKTGHRLVTAPQAIGNTSGHGSPIWVSANGTAWGNPVSAPNDPVSGGDTDIVSDSAGNIYQTDLWLGNSANAVSTDGGQTFVANEWGHALPADDRPWLAYSPSDGNLYVTYDGLDAIYVGRTSVATSPYGGLTFPQDVPAVPECLLGGSNPCSQPPVRQCVCPPGGIATDPKTGEVYISYSEQNSKTLGGVGIAYSTDNGLQWSYSSVPHTGSTGSAFDTEWNFSPIRVDNNGTAYVAWGEGQKIDANGIATGGVLIKYAYSTDHGKTWSRPVTVSRTSKTNVFPTLSVVSPGVIAVGYYGDPNFVGDPNQATGSWNVYVAKVTNAATTAPTVTDTTAVAGNHTGCIQVGGGASCSDRSLLDFFQLEADPTGAINIIYTAGSAASGTALYFTKN